MNLWGKLKEIERGKSENTESRLPAASRLHLVATQAGAIFTRISRDTPHLQRMRSDTALFIAFLCTVVILLS